MSFKKVFIMVLCFMLLISLVSCINEKSKSSNNKIKFDKVMTWGEFLDSDWKGHFYEDANHNPNPEVNNDRKVRVVITEYPNGKETLDGFYDYGLTCNVFDAETKKLLDSAGEYKNKKS